MNQVTNFESLNKAVLAQFRPYLDSLSREKHAELAETWIRSMTGEPVRESVFPDSNRLSVLLAIASRVKELRDSLFSLSQVPKYLTTEHSTFQDPHPSVWLTYHMTGWMEEIYILQLRWLAFSTRLERLYRREPDAEAIRETLAKCDQVLKQALDQPLKFRGAHVHERRHIDPKLARLRAVEAAIQHFSELNDEVKLQSESLRAERVEFMVKTNQDLVYMLDWFAEYLKPLFFPTGEWRMPRLLADR